MSETKKEEKAKGEQNEGCGVAVFFLVAMGSILAAGRSADTHRWWTAAAEALVGFLIFGILFATYYTPSAKLDAKTRALAAHAAAIKLMADADAKRTSTATKEDAP
jgi:hypothetical protein